MLANFSFDELNFPAQFSLGSLFYATSAIKMHITVTHTNCKVEKWRKLVAESFMPTAQLLTTHCVTIVTHALEFWQWPEVIISQFFHGNIDLFLLHQ